MTERRPRYGAPPTGALDLRPGLGGQSGNFGLPEDRERAIKLVASCRPFLLIGSPPCTDWCGSVSYTHLRAHETSAHL
eukprot:14675160-Alexandrium_andersonii.AAC.1